MWLDFLTYIAETLYIKGYSDGLLNYVIPKRVKRKFPLGCFVQHKGDRTCYGKVIGYGEPDSQGNLDLLVYYRVSKTEEKLFPSNCEVTEERP